MHARQLVVPIRPGSVEEAVDMFRRDVVPLLRRQAGFVGTSLLVDPQSGSAQFITYWTSLADLARLGERRFFDAQVAKLSTLFAATPEVRILDVGLLEIGHAGSAPDAGVTDLVEGDR